MKRYNKKKINAWVAEHYINGPSTSIYKNLRNNEVLIMYDISKNKYSICNKSDDLSSLESGYNIFYVVFRDELNKFLASL